MDPNNEVTDGDFWDLALAVSLLKTLQGILDYALETNQRVVCEHWGGFESGSAGAGTSASLEIAAPASTDSELLTPSPQLAAIVGEQRLRRTEIVSKLWAYVKANGLRDSTTPRMINADARLLPIFGKAQVSMFELAAILGNHVR
ncbi:MAG: hypothetical protein CFE43_20380 [Burkholderiales bacterium PBB3]|nr:MAG: hypothetical protein CFE43_20380 [Burkholderiales bacterium PBB3]